ncbi:ABC transporter permease [Nocardioides halotolerans]|jgi:ABC-type transport system involved in multi-copper enzyme maturation permease subunit|uniref:ABC transporter permease n=1 Tax=Nocardioides halotolerans TaxID=433660 RepID=UPI0004079487|nr:ABC transporter permease [Nocardioides halotolerans]
MSATAAPTAIDFSSTQHVPMSRLARVEIRKALDTRAGRWLIIGILGLVVLIEVIYSFAADNSDKNLQDYIQIPGFTLGYFLPIVIIMLVTSEASQRNGLVTFTLEPRRSRIVLAKFIAGVTLALSVMVLAVILAVLGTLLGIATGGDVSWHLDGGLVFYALFLSNMIGIFIGFALSMLIMNTAGAIVAYFAYTLILPSAVGILSAISDTFEKIGPWIEFNTAQSPLVSSPYSPTGEEWAQIVVAGAIWLVLPLVLGIGRLLRIEFK